MGGGTTVYDNTGKQGQERWTEPPSNSPALCEPGPYPLNISLGMMEVRVGPETSYGPILKMYKEGGGTHMKPY